MRRFFVLPLVLALGAGLGCDPEDADPAPLPGAPCDDVADAADLAAVQAWADTTLKDCSLAAVLPHRSAAVVVHGRTGFASGLDKEVVLGNADGNGVRRFDDEGRRFAAFENFRPIPDDTAVEETIGGPRTCEPGAAPRLTASATYRDGLCTVVVAGETVFSAPLYQSFDMPLAGPFGPVASVPKVLDLPAADGFAWIELPFIGATTGFDKSGVGARVVGEWLGLTEGQSVTRINVGGSGRGDVLASATGAIGPLVDMDGANATLVSADELRMLTEQRDVAFTWYYTRPTEPERVRPASVFELSADGMRYVGVAERDTADAARAGAACFARIANELLDAGQPVRGPHSIRFNWLGGCARLTGHLGDAVVADGVARDTLMYLLSDEVSERVHGPDASQVPIISPVDTFIASALGQLLRADDDALAAYPSRIVDDAAQSWEALVKAGVFASHPELAALASLSVARRALNSVAERARGNAGRDPLSDEAARALATALEGLPELSPSQLLDVAEYIEFDLALRPR